jgi:hypothetical protein
VQRSVVHVLLSLLLLLSQQVSMLHGYSHTNDVQQRPATATIAQPGDTGGKPAKAALLDLCSQCAASAQVAFALPTVVRLFVPVELAFNLRPAPRTPSLCLLTRCVFRSRAPPPAL